MFSIVTAISYLVSKKFGITAALIPALEMIQKNKITSSEKSKQAIDIENYEKSLRAKPTYELEQIYKQALIHEENSRFYNLASADADFEHWSKAEHWTIDEAISLSFGKEPNVVTWKLIEELKDKTDFAMAFAKRRDLALRASKLKKFKDLIPLIYFLNWAEELEIRVSSELIDAVAKYVGMPVNWHQKYVEVSAELDLLREKSSGAQKNESTLKMENLLQAFTAIAIDAYGYNPEVKSTAPRDIADALAKLGKEVTSKSIRNWLKEGSELLPYDPHRD